MSRIADYVATLSADERRRFAGLIEECRDRETRIAAGSARAEAALTELDRQERELGDSVRRLQQSSADLKDHITRLVLVAVPPRGRVS